MRAFGLSYAPRDGLQASLTAVAEGSRFLDPQNLASVGGFMNWDAMLGYRWHDTMVRLTGTNLGDRRDPVLPSDLGEGQFYRLPARRVALSVSVAL